MQDGNATAQPKSADEQAIGRIADQIRQHLRIVRSVNAGAYGSFDLRVQLSGGSITQSSVTGTHTTEKHK